MARRESASPPTAAIQVREAPRNQQKLAVPARKKDIAAAAAAKLLQLYPALCDPIDASPPGSPSLGFSRQEHWSGLPFPSPMQESEK